MDLRERIKQRLDFIFKTDYTQELLDSIVERIEQAKRKIKSGGPKWTERDTVLITYGDSIVKQGEPPLGTLKEFLDNKLKDSISFVHILPFFPYSSDDGFSVIDYKKVNPVVGDWSHVEELSENFKLMFDLVINHISQESEWFRKYLRGEHPESEFFIEADPKQDLSAVVRPRSLPLLTKVETADGAKHVWTTFSEDQIDLNFANPFLLARMIDIFLFYLEQGASMIRLDAIAFLWKEIGTNCLHLPETHEFVKLLRDITDYIGSGLILLTETNVPNKENLSYFGENDEANMVYQFSLPPLLLNSLYTANSTYLTSWAESIPELSKENTFFNFTASHDGIGMRPLEGIVPTDEINALADAMMSFGGRVNTKRNSDGSDSPYELNITYFDALKGTIKGKDKMQMERFICSQTIMMSLQGMPTFYIHSLLGTSNYYEGIEKTGMNRTINRRKWNAGELYSLLESDSTHARILKELTRLIKIRITQDAFHPNANQRILPLGSDFFGFSRNNDSLFVISNISFEHRQVNIRSIINNAEKDLVDLISGGIVSSNDEIMELSPYQTVWLVQQQ